MQTYIYSFAHQISEPSTVIQLSVGMVGLAAARKKI